MGHVSRRAIEITFPQFDRLNARAAQLRRSGHSVISFGQAVPDFGPPAAALDALTEALRSPDAHLYAPDAGIEPLRQALSAKLRETMAAALGADDVIITAGGNQAFMLALLSTVDAGDEVVLTAPYFANHEMSVRASGAVPVEAPLPEAGGFAPSWEHVEPHLTSRTRAVVVCNPSNPTGAVAGRAALGQIAEQLRARGITLVVDETYMHFVYSADGHTCGASLPAWRENVVVVGTFSKQFGITGWRVGYLLADERICQQAIKIQDAMIICAPTSAQIGVAAAVNQSWGYALARRDELASRRALLQAELATIPALSWEPTHGGFFAFVHVRGCRDSLRLAEELLEHTHVVTIPGAVFGASGEGFLRLAYGGVGHAALREGMGRLRGYLQ